MHEIQCQKLKVLVLENQFLDGLHKNGALTGTKNSGELLKEQAHLTGLHKIVVKRLQFKPQNIHNSRCDI